MEIQNGKSTAVPMTGVGLDAVSGFHMEVASRKGGEVVQLADSWIPDQELNPQLQIGDDTRL